MTPSLRIQSVTKCGCHGNRSMRRLVMLHLQSESREVNAGAQFRAPAHGSVPPAVRMALPTSVNPVRAQRFVLQVVVEPSKVTVLATTRTHIESG